jgi:predicted permease
LADELRFHLEKLAEENVEEGMTPEEARYAALRELGGVEQIKEECRDMRRMNWIENSIQDLRYGLRRLARNPGFTAVAVLTLALGIGANAAVFTLTYSVILKTLPLPNPQQLVRYTFRNGNQDLGLSGPLYDALSKQESAVTGLLAWSGAKLAVQENGEVKSVNGAMMTGNGFRVLELHPALGRAFSVQDDVPSGGPNGYQALLGYDYWKDHFLGASSVLGRSFAINGRAVTIIGVLPKGFEGLIAGDRTEILLPLAFEEIVNAPDSLRHTAGSFWLTVMGRLKQGQSVRTARADLYATEAAVREGADPKHMFLSGFFAPFKLGVESGSSGRSFLRIAYESPLVVLEILVGLLLLLCCANTALLTLARVSSRQPEFAVRVALGAPRVRLFRLVLSEVALLGACGLGGGIMLGWWAAKSLVAMLASIGEPPPIDVTPHAAILAFTAGITLFSTLAASLWPALSATRIAPQPALKQTQRSATLKHLGGWFVPVQVAVSIVLLACALLLSETFLHLLFEDSGFHASKVVMADVDLSAAQPTAAQAAQYAWQILEYVEHAPGVESAALMSMPPLHDWWSSAHYFSVDQRGGVHSDMQTWPETVSLGYFATMGTAIEEGRGFSRQNLSGQPVCILSTSAARYFFSGEDPVGKFIYASEGDPSLDGKTKLDPKNACAVIGVAEDAHFRSLHEAPPRMVYTPFRPDEPGSMFTLAVRARRSADGVSAIRRAMHRIAPAAAEPSTYTFNELIEQHLRSERMLTALSSSFAGVALLLTALGLYGLLARDVAMRTKEIGIRLALGARPQDVLGLVIRQGLKLVLIGAGVGLPVSLVAPRVLRSLLLGIKPGNPLLLVGIAAVLMLVAFLACYIPARRAAKVDPTVTLRYE